MLLDPKSCYRALKTHDPRFDGRFFVGVATTGIYCRPICTAKTPQRQHCNFFSSAAAAEAQGYRPCLRCRPELAPGNARVDALGRLAQRAASLIEDGWLTWRECKYLADQLGVSERHVRRVFQSEYGVSPIQYAQTQRLLLAKRLLTDTAMPVIEVASASGFSSLRRFNALFKERYRLSPTALRRGRVAMGRDVLQFELAYRPPYAWTEQLNFLMNRVIEGVEQVSGACYLRTAAITVGEVVHRGWIEVRANQRKATLQIAVSAGLSKVVPALLARIKRLFDLSCDPQQVAAQLGSLAEALPGLRVPGAFDGFELAVRAILGQQVSVSAASRLAGRLAAELGQPAKTPHAMLTTYFPRAEDIARCDIAQIAALGIIRSRAKAISVLAQAIVQGRLCLEPSAAVEMTMQQLRTIPGIGEWTAHYIAMRALAWPDAFLHTDLGVQKAMQEKSKQNILARAEQWRPWRAYAVIYLWRLLEKRK